MGSWENGTTEFACYPKPVERYRREALFNRSDRLAAGDFDSLRVHPAVVFGEEAGDHEADVIGKADATEGGEFGEGFVELGIVTDPAAAEIGLDGTGGDGIDGDAAPPEFLRHVNGEDFDGTFHGGIDRVAGIGKAGEPGGDIHDAATIGDEGKERLGEEENAFEVDVHKPVELRFGRLLDRRVIAVAGIVDEVVEGIALPSLFEGVVEVFGEGRESGNIARI